MQSKSADLQDQINQIDAQIQAGASDAQLNVWEMQKSDLKKDLETALADEANQQRVIDATATAVNKGSLDGLDSDTAELIGIYVADAVKTEQTKNEESTQQLMEAYKGKLDNLTAQAIETENQLAAERQHSASVQEENTALHIQNGQLIAEKLEAENKRDAAIREKEAETSRVNHLSNMVDDANKEIARLNAHVDDLRTQLANAPAPKAAIDVTPSERAQELIKKIQLKNVQYADFKRSTLQGEDKDGNIVQVNYLDAAKIEHVTEFPSLPQLENPAEPVHTFQEIQTGNTEGNTAVEGNGDIPEVLAKPAEAPVTRAEHEALAARVTALESGSGQVAA